MLILIQIIISRKFRYFQVDYLRKGLLHDLCQIPPRNFAYLQDFQEKKGQQSVSFKKKKNFSKFPNRSYEMRYPAEGKAAALNARFLACLIFHQVNRNMQSFKPALENCFALLEVKRDRQLDTVYEMGINEQE